MNHSTGVAQHAALLALVAVVGVVIFVVLHHAGVGVLPKMPALPGVGH